MTLEQKAKRYDEISKEVKDFFNGKQKMYTDVTKTLEFLFPELCESEDEQIRKDIIKFIKKRDRSGCEYDYDKWIAWLEKQGNLMKALQISNSHIMELTEENFYLKEQLEKKSEQKLADKVESKFKIGDWVVCEVGELTSTLQITNIEKGYYWFCDDSYLPVVDKDCLHLWTIQDAKDGDVLAYVTDEEDLWIMIYWSLYEPYEGHVHYHALLVNDDFSNKGTCCICINDLKPATKEQRDTLFTKMKEAGYEWDAEKKELKKIHVIDEGKAEMDYCFTKMMNGEKVSSTWSEEDEEVNGEDYGIDGLWHAQRILEKTLGSVDGYQSDDGILDHKAAITAVKKLYKQQLAWSEEDEYIIEEIEAIIDAYVLEENNPKALIDWLKSLKDRYTWKPSNEQIYTLEHFVRSIGESGYASPYDNNTKLLYSLLEQLKKLKE